MESIVKEVKNKIIYIKNTRILNKSLKEIKTLKNSHSGERCFVIGNGPSLTVEDLELLKNEYTFATNGIFKLFDKTDWRPSCYFVQDYHFISNNIKKINSVKSPFKVVVRIPSYKYKKIKNSLSIRWLYKTEDNLPFFSEDIENGVYEGRTVLYSAIQLAFYMGFKTVYLIGVDHKYSVERKADGTIINNEVKDYAFQDKQEKLPFINIPSTEATTLAFKSAKKYAGNNGLNIFNVTRGGYLEVFERKKLEDIL